MTMKKLIAILATMALLLCGIAVAEEETPADVNDRINSLIEDGQFIIQVDAGGDLAWVADDMAQDPSVVELAFTDVVEDTFVARYAPVGDGDITVGVRHYTGLVCDEMMTWDLHVENGAVQEVIGGSYAVSPADEENDPYLLGAWLEAENQFDAMTVEKNPERGWDVEIVSPVSHGAFVFKGSVLYDCERNCFAYDKGKFWDIDGEYDGSQELGEATLAGTVGAFTLVGDDQNLMLEWYDEDRPVEGTVFVPAEAEAAN